MKRYKIRYWAGEDRGLSIDFDASSPVTALNQFHRMMQLDEEILPDKYGIKSIGLYYNSDASGNQRGEWIESLFDLPDTKNPIIPKAPRVDAEDQTTAFPFLKEIPVAKSYEMADRKTD